MAQFTGYSRCTFQADADYNASCNHEINLPYGNILRFLVHKKYRSFFWKERGVYDVLMQEITVPATREDNKRQ